MDVSLLTLYENEYFYCSLSGVMRETSNSDILFLSRTSLVLFHLWTLNLAVLNVRKN